MGRFGVVCALAFGSGGSGLRARDSEREGLGLFGGDVEGDSSGETFVPAGS
jgi:hypothetical protein